MLLLLKSLSDTNSAIDMAPRSHLQLVLSSHTKDNKQTNCMHSPTQATMHLEHYNQKEMCQFFKQVVKKHTLADTKAPLQNRKKVTFYATQKPEEPPCYSSPQQMPAFGPLQLNKQEEKKDRMDRAIFASKRK